MVNPTNKRAFEILKEKKHLAICIGFVLLLYASSCSRPADDNREALVNGEVFIALPKFMEKPGERPIILQPGTIVFFLTEDEKKRFANFCRDRLDKELPRYKAELDELKNRKEEFITPFPPTLLDIPIHGSNASQAVSELLRSAKSVSTDSKGEFAIKLRRGTSYWVLPARAGDSTPDWCFRVDSSNPRVVLSDGNLIKELGNPF